MRKYLDQLKHNQSLARVEKKISKDYQIAGVLKQMEPRPVLFSNLAESVFSVAGNLFTGKQALAQYLVAIQKK